MEFDKEIEKLGIWSESEDANILDKYAYYLYLKNIYVKIPDLQAYKQSDLLKHYYDDGFSYSKHYNDAKIILRKEKINKIKENINGL